MQEPRILSLTGLKNLDNVCLNRRANYGTVIDTTFLTHAGNSSFMRAYWYRVYCYSCSTITEWDAHRLGQQPSSRFRFHRSQLAKRTYRIVQKDVKCDIGDL